MPSALKVSVAVIHVVMPGRVESIAVSSVQSMNAPFGRRKRSVGSTEASTAGVTLGRISVARDSPSTGGELSDRSEDGVVAQGGPDMPFDRGGGADAAPSAEDPCPDDAAKTGPWSLRSSELIRGCTGVAAPG